MIMLLHSNLDNTVRLCQKKKKKSCCYKETLLDPHRPELGDIGQSFVEEGAVF